MKVDIAGIMTKIALLGIAYWLVDAGGNALQDAAGSLRARQVTTTKGICRRTENPGKYWLWVGSTFLWGVLLCFIAGAIIYYVIPPEAASTLR